MKAAAVCATTFLVFCAGVEPVFAADKTEKPKTVKEPPDTTVEVEYLSQHDARWRTSNITGYETISASGCFPTVAAMAVSAQTGEELTPLDTGKALHDNGYYGVVRGNLLSVGTFSDGWGFIEEEYDVETEGLESDEVAAFLKDGGVVALSVSGIFIQAGAAHEILITQTDAEGRQVYVMDPNNEEANGWYDLESISSNVSTEWWNTYEGCAFVGIR